MPDTYVSPLEVVNKGNLNMFFEILSTISRAFTLVPIIAISALFFYVCCALLFWAPFKSYFTSTLALPVPSSNTVFMPLDSFRGFAAIWVVIYHAFVWIRPHFEVLAYRVEWLIKGRRGVAIFFVLSGFLIYRSALKIKSLEDIRAYLIRRFLRIYPLLFLTIILTYVLGFRDFRLTTIQSIVAELLLLPAISNSPISNLPSHTVFIEILYYLFMPLWVVMIRKNRIQWLAMASLIFIFLGNSELFSRGAIFLRYFFFGMLLSEILELRWVRTLSQIRVAGIFVLGVILFFTDTWSLNFGIEPVFAKVFKDSFSFLGIDRYIHFDPSPYSNPPSESTLLGISIFFVLLGTLLWRPAFRFFSFFPFRVIGHVSYSIFLLQGFLLHCQSGKTFEGGELTLHHAGTRFEFFLIYLPALLMWSVITYVLIEKPFIEFGHKLGLSACVKKTGFSGAPRLPNG